jgi:toxin ParE1/3/4
MRRLIWQPKARAQLKAIILYIADRNYPAAMRLEASILHHIDHLRALPFIGRAGKLAGTRELVVHPNYILIYRVGEDVVEIIRVLHAHQQYP